jgi:hypothetical protein
MFLLLLSSPMVLNILCKAMTGLCSMYFQYLVLIVQKERVVDSILAAIKTSKVALLAEEMMETENHSRRCHIKVRCLAVAATWASPRFSCVFLLQ